MWLIQLKWKCRQLMPCLIIRTLIYLCFQVEKISVNNLAAQPLMSLIAPQWFLHILHYGAHLQGEGSHNDPLDHKIIAWKWHPDLCKSYDCKVHFISEKFKIAAVVAVTGMLFSLWFVCSKAVKLLSHKLVFLCTIALCLLVTASLWTQVIKSSAVR